jgi:hypothetical protein
MLTARRLQRWLNLGVVLGAIPAPAWATATVFAGTGLVARSWAPWAAALGGLGGVLWVARVLSRERWTESQAAVRLDRLASAQGLLLTLKEIPDSRWEPLASRALQQVRLPPLGAGRALAWTGCAAAFSLLTLLLPHPAPPGSRAQTAVVSSVAALETQTAALSAERVIPSNLQDEIRKLSEEAKSGSFNAADWEAMDDVSSRVEDEARRQSDALARAAEAARRLQQAIGQGAAEESLAREREALEQALAALEARAPGNEGKTATKASANPANQEGRDGSGRAPTSSQALRNLQRSLESRREELSRRFPGTGRPSPGTRSARAGQKGMSFLPGGQPGTDDPLSKTPLDYGAETKFQTERLRYAPMPQGRAAGEPGELWGMVSAPPTPTPHAVVTAPLGNGAGDELAPGVRAGAAPPRDRELVRRYFDVPSR